MLKNLNTVSRVITQSNQNGSAQAMMYALGFNKIDLDKPQVGIASMWYDGNPCNSKLNILSDKSKYSINSEQLLGLRFNTIGVSDGMSMGTIGMRYSLPSRELIADSIETIMMGQHYDSLICIPGCDKNLPASAMALARLNRPGFIIYGGSMKPSYYNEEKLDIVSAFESYGRYINGEINLEERQNILENSCDKGCGSCSGLYTANTMACIFETMGLTLPNSSSNFSLGQEKFLECELAGKTIKNMLINNIRPLDIITKDSIINAIKMLYLTGGSTNGVIHLLAIATTANIDITLNDFSDLENIPVILNMKPHGDNVMYDLYKLGGTQVLIKYLIENQILNGDCLTITGKTLYENTTKYNSINFDNQNVILPIEKPFKKNSHIKILKGNLAPDGCVAKINSNNTNFKGRALVFNSEKDMLSALKNHEITKEHFVVLRFQGESIGCPEMLSPTSALVGYFGNNPPPLATDGRFSGGSKGILIAHLPDAYKNKSTRCINNGDLIEINLDNNTINIQSNLNFEKDKPELHINGYLKKYTKLVGNINTGYIT